MQKDEQEIRRLVATWMEATKAGNLDTVLGLMADDVVFLVAGQPPMVGKAAYAAAAQAMSSQDQPQFDGKSDIQEIRVQGDWAYMWAKLSVVVTPPDGAPPVMRVGHTLTIFQKRDDEWLLARDANMLTTVSE